MRAMLKAVALMRAASEKDPNGSWYSTTTLCNVQDTKQHQKTDTQLLL